MGFAPVEVDYAALEKIGVTCIAADEDGRELFIVGTAHVSDESVDDVKRAVRAIQPDLLMVELCPQRAQLLFPPQVENENEEPGTMKQIKQTMSERQGLSGVFQLLLSRLYKKVGKEIQITPGAEFRAALEAVKETGRPFQVLLGDRAIGVTIQRAWALLPLREKVLLCFQLIQAMFTSIAKEDIERMKQSDVLAELMVEFVAYFPSLAKVLLKERDVYLARSLYQCRPAQRVLAVVGLGHVKGMEETIARWKESPELEEIECRDLLIVPKTSWTGRRMALAFGVVLVGLGVGAFFGVKSLIRYFW